MLRLQVETESMLSIDVLRFVAAVGVVALHYAEPVVWSFGADGGRLGFLGLLVDVFFVLSGYVIARVYGGRLGTWAGYGDFLRRRFSRLAPLHYATLALYVALGLALLVLGVQSSTPSTFTWTDLPGTLLFANSLGATKSEGAFNFPSWSISAEMVMYTLAPFFFWLGRRPWVLLGFAVAALVGLHLLPGPPFSRTIDLGVLRALAAFPFGVWLAARRTLSAPGWAWPAALVLLFALGAMGVQEIALWPLAYAVAALAIAADAGGNSAGMRSAAPLGQLTYSAYMLHMPVRTLFVAYLGQRALGLEGWPYAAWTLLGALLLLPIAYISYAFYEMPARKLINRLRLPRRDQLVQALD